MAKSSPKLKWIPFHDKRLIIRGQGWQKELKGSLHRLPDRCEGVVTSGVWGNSLCSSGIRICFRSNSRHIAVRVKLANPSTMSHMPSTGQSGVILFSGDPYCTQPWGSAWPSGDRDCYEKILATNLSAKMREYTLYLPLYNEVVDLDLGVSPGARFTSPSKPALAKPVVFYGTSISMGGCAHTPEADYVSIVSRRLNLDTINLGFSGAGRGEPEMAEMLVELDVAAYVLDYVANSTIKSLKKTLPIFVKILRRHKPEIPIILLSRTLGYGMHYNANSWEHFELLRDETIHFYSKVRKKGDMNIHFIDGNPLIPPCTDLVHSDGGHPTSVGFKMMADLITPQLENILLMRK
ncbi:SGNH/GDSL hydrolase family protein [bacterium AH-315-E10]|nr:SGNH/GDSL hydrolase family protein [bacterium AH-315-E10]